MARLIKLKTWKSLAKHQLTLVKQDIADLFAEDANRFDKFSLSDCDILLDFSKHYLTSDTLDLFCKLSEECELGDHIDALFSGKNVNTSEQMPALHTALRTPDHSSAILVDGHDIMPDIHSSLTQMLGLADKIHTKQWRGHTNKPITDIVNIGIGGSQTGPQMVIKALAPFVTSELHFHFVSNIDPAEITDTLKKLNPETTLFIVASKSFTTIETLINADIAKKWLLQHCEDNNVAIAKHFIGITHSVASARAYGIPENNILLLWPWIGGRYSIWSSVGLSLAIAIGSNHFKEFLLGANNMDQHFKNTSFHNNMPLIMALLSVWYINFFNTPHHAIIPYSYYLQYFPRYIQQLDMESNGKSITQDNKLVDYHTGPVVFGDTGTNSQHSFHQLLFQGTHLVPADFILPINQHSDEEESSQLLLANFLSQTEALMMGQDIDEIEATLKTQGLSEEAIEALAPHHLIPGNQPSNSILLHGLTPKTLGSLIALYEHKTFTQGIIWHINSFDQWGVELGKRLAKNILTDDNVSSSTKGLLARYNKVK